MRPSPKSSATWLGIARSLVAIEAAAVAIWLVPASVHIVKWPASGPVRLALTQPVWMLAVFAIAMASPTTAVSLIDPRAHVTGRRQSLPWVLAPLTLLWLWVVPYLPWLPDRLPLLLVLAGPLRWIVAGVAALMVMTRGLGVEDWPRTLTRIGRTGIFVLSLVVYAGMGVISVRTTAVGGDEPHYLIIAESLLHDGDLQIENNHQRGDYKSFFAGELKPDYFVRGKNGAIYSIHAPGLPALLLPAYAIAGRLGAVLFIAFLAALTSLAVFDLTVGIGGQVAGIIAWAACCLTVPFVPYAWLIFPEMPGALLVAWAALWLWRQDDRPAWQWAVRGAALAVLPWLHTKFALFLGIFAAALALKLLRRPRALAAFAAPIAVSGALWLYSFYAIYGTINWEAPYGDYTKLYVLTRNVPHGLLGIFFDQKFGLLFYSPIYLVAIGGAWLALRRSDTRFVAAVLLLVIAAFVGSTARLYMFWGGSSAPARFLVPVLPCLAPLIALAVRHARRSWSRALVGLCFVASLGVAIAGVSVPSRFILFSDPHNGGARLLELIQGGSPLALVAPRLTEPDWASQTPTLVAWAIAVTATIVALVVAGRLWNTNPLRVALVSGIVFLVGGATLAARPDQDSREATARRGDLDVLWRYDGSRFRTFDYERLGRTTPERLRELTTVAFSARGDDDKRAAYAAGPISVPPGTFDVRTWFNGGGARDGEVVVSGASAVLARLAGPLPNPAIVSIDLPVTIRRLSVHVPQPLGEAVSRIELVPKMVVPPSGRADVDVRALESVPGRPGAYLVYTDEHAYPENGVFWSRGTAETRLLLAPAGASRLTLTLSSGPRNSTVKVTVHGHQETVAMAADEIQTVSFDLPPAERLVPLAVQSSAMFRPAEVAPGSTDMRGLGCQVRVSLE